MKFAFTDTDIDISKITFSGASRSYERKIALLATALIWLGLLYIGYEATNIYGDTPIVQNLAVILIVSMVLQLAFTGRLWMMKFAHALFYVTPLGVLYRRDKKILKVAKEELLRIAGYIEFKGYSGYGKLNPAIRSGESLAVMTHQEKGDLAKWVNNARNLKKLADLVYQMYLVEQFIILDDKNR